MSNKSRKTIKDKLPSFLFSEYSSQNSQNYTQWSPSSFNLTSHSNQSLVNTKFSMWLNNPGLSDGSDTRSFKEFLQEQDKVYSTEKDKTQLKIIPSTSTSIIKRKRLKTNTIGYSQNEGKRKSGKNNGNNLCFKSSLDVNDDEPGDVDDEISDDSRPWMSVKSFPEFSSKNKFDVK